MNLLLTFGDSAKCKQTFRGHAESVNHVGFQPYTNLLYSCSGDKTISFWDGRTGICSSTLFGHMSTINHAAFSLKVGAPFLLVNVIGKCLCVV